MPRIPSGFLDFKPVSYSTKFPLVFFAISTRDGHLAESIAERIAMLVTSNARKRNSTCSQQAGVDPSPYEKLAEVLHELQFSVSSLLHTALTVSYSTLRK